MANLPVIVGFGGVNAAGRSSFHHSYKRMIVDQLSPADSKSTFLGLATMMGYLKYEDGKYVDKNGSECNPHSVREKFGKKILDNTLVRRINTDQFDPDNTLWNHKIKTKLSDDAVTSLVISKKNLPENIPSNWEVKEIENDSQNVNVSINGNFDFYVETPKKVLCQSAAQLPKGFNPRDHYKSNSQPRGLTLAIFGASDAINSIGVDWQAVKDSVRPDQIGVYSASAMGQLDDFGCKGYLSAPALSKRPSAKQLPLGLADMPADFVNAYVAGNVGFTSANVGACATFLNNLNLAVKDIKNGVRRVAIVGSAEAPIVPEIIEAYRVMGALAEDEKLIELDKHLGLASPDYRRGCRPFGENCGFVLAESSQYVILFDDELTLELGAQVHGSVGDIFINADGFKKSIASPGFGNYISLAKAVASARAILGPDSVSNHSYIQSHGSGTPQNRVTESHIMNEIAKTFNINKWPVSAIKSFVGHSLGPASGDQIMATLGAWKYGFIPGITTIDSAAGDVHTSNLQISNEHINFGAENIDVTFVNAKGFGGNNASGAIISPTKTMEMLEKRHGSASMKKHAKQNESVVEAATNYDQKVINGDFTPIYKFGEGVLTDKDLSLTDKGMNIPGFAKDIDLDLKNPYPEMDISK